MKEENTTKPGPNQKNRDNKQAKLAEALKKNLLRRKNIATKK